jgi:hypothetical protein
MFFTEQRIHFFRPLSGKYRAQIVECLRELYQRLYSATNADYGQALQRETLIGIFQEALVRMPATLPDDTASEDDTRFRNTREQAVWVLNQLLEHDWLEKQLDQATLNSTFAFSRYGREFTEPFVNSNRTLAHTRHRNTRNTRNSLQAFAERGDVYDLLDAFEYSERIISDFTDVIAELDERKRDLVREMEDQLLVRHASEAFFDFMENRFQPDLSVRLSADNVERHRDQIEQLVRAIRRRDKAFKAGVEKRLRQLLPEQIQPGQSLLWWVLDGIEQRLRNASEVMLPALRRALQGFTRRADIIMRQMSYLASRQHNDVLSVCQNLAKLPATEQDARLLQAAECLALPGMGFVDPAQVRLAPPRQRALPVAFLDKGEAMFDMAARKEIWIQQLLDQAFLINQKTLRNWLLQQLGSGQRICSRDLPITSAEDFMAVAHAISLGSAEQISDGGFRIRVDYENASGPTPWPPVLPDTHLSEPGYFLRKDHFVFELVASD